MNNKRRKNNQEQQQTQQEQEDADKKSQHRRTVDYFTPHGKHMIRKNVYNCGKKRQPLGYIRPDMSYITELPPPSIYQPEVFDLATKFVHVSTNKSKHAIHAIKWTPDARRVLVSSYSGEFTLWNGLTFNFESIMQAHDSPIFSLEYSHNAKWLISGDQSGCIKFWQPNFNNVNILTKAHENAIQDLCFSPTDSKFISCSDDQLLKVWNFTTAEEERVLKGHHWDVKCCDWHSSLGLIVSGSKDNLVKFWDPRDATCLTTIHDFKHTVTKTKFQKTGNERLLAACSRDHSTRIYDIRMMKPMTIIKSQNDADLSSITWHPIHSNVLTIGGYDGSLSTYNLDKSIDVENLRSLGNNELDSTFLTENKNTLNNVSDAWHRIPHAHDKAIYTLEYHPLGHMLCTAGADKSMRFWCRSRPNDKHGFMDSAYTGESWSEKQQNVAIGDIVNNGDDSNGETTEKQDSIALPGFSLPGFS